jgi:enamine deaminase RidA (YjgF/YER057c/UK114 family)
MSAMQILQPPGWAKPKGFSNGIAASGNLVFVAGPIGWTGEGKWEAKDFAGQFRQALKNCIDVVAQAGGRPDHIVRLTWYITSKKEYLASLKEVGAAYRALMGRHFPVMAVVEVSALMEDEAKLEIEATAVVPAEGAYTSLK